MSTRCQIGFYRDKPCKETLRHWDALIYRHSDGYPEGVLPEVVPFLKEFKAGRGIGDTEYCAARTLQHLCNLYDESLKDGSHISQSYRFLGHGICKDLHGDIEFFYAVYPDGVDVYSVTGTKQEPYIFGLVTTELI